MKTTTKIAAAKSVPIKITKIHGIDLKDIVPIDIAKPNSKRVKSRSMSLSIIRQFCLR